MHAAGEDVTVSPIREQDFSDDMGKIGAGTGATSAVSRVSGLTFTAGTEKGGSDHGFSAGATFYQCNAIGTPIGYALAMGRNALYYAKGAVFGEQIFHYDDFANSGNEAHLSAVGIQSVYGMAARRDTRARIPAVQMVEVVRQVPGLTLAN